MAERDRAGQGEGERLMGREGGREGGQMKREGGGVGGRGREAGEGE